jgi:hypothetical protein
MYAIVFRNFLASVLMEITIFVKICMPLLSKQISTYIKCSGTSYLYFGPCRTVQESERQCRIVKYTAGQCRKGLEIG